jgi:hypothetical protein
MLIYHEDLIRAKLDMPRLLANPLDASNHALFYEFVRDGHKNPYFEWEMALKESDRP